MCSTCGCAEGERFIEGDETHPGDEQHSHEHHHHQHDAMHHHSPGHHHDHPHAGHEHQPPYPDGTQHFNPGQAAFHDHDHAGHPHPDVADHQHDGAPAARRIDLRSAAAAPVTQIIHNHYYYAEVHNHYYPFTAAPAPIAPTHGIGRRASPPDPSGYYPGQRQAVVRADSLPQTAGQGSLDYGQGEAGAHAPGLSQRRMVEIEIDVLDKNNRLAAVNRQYFQAQNILALNLVSSPGSGKTRLLCETLSRLRGKTACAVIEGDQQTSNDADRIRATGAPAIQVNTGKGCHLDAQMVQDAVQRLQPAEHSLLFIENVGNLVCPAGFDLGEQCKVVVLSVTEGEDKPLKYPHMFAAAGLMILNKTDLLPWVQFDVEACIANARRVNPAIGVLQVSATSGEGMDAWLDWLANAGLTGQEQPLCA